MYGKLFASFGLRRARRGAAARRGATPEGPGTRKTPGRGVDVFLLSVVLGGLVTGALVRPVVRGGDVSLAFGGYRLPAICWFRTATGLPCPSCGLTRSVVFLLHGRWAESRAAHPFGVPVLALILLAVPPRVAAVLRAGRSWVAKWDRAWGFAIAAVLLCMLSWWAFRIGLAIASSR